MSRQALVSGFAVWVALAGCGGGGGSGDGDDDGDGASDVGDADDDDADDAGDDAGSGDGDDGGDGDGGDDDGDGDGGPVDPPPPVDPDCQVAMTLSLEESRALVPFAAGNRWFYRGRSEIEPDFVRDYSRAVDAAEPTTVDGQVVQPLRTIAQGKVEASDLEYWSIDDTGLYNHGFTGYPPEPEAATPYPVMEFPVDVCRTFWAYVVTEPSDYDVDGDGVLETVEIRSQIWQRGLEDVETLLGIFPNSLRLERTTTTTTTTSMTMSSSSVAESSVSWFAPGVGLVKQTRSPQGDRRYTEELIGYAVDGAGRGAVALGTIAPNLAQSDSDELDVGRPAVASDGEGFLAVVRDDNSAGVLRGRLVSRDGAVETGPDLGVSGTMPVLGFDGTNYLLAYHNDGEIRGLRLSRQGAPIGAPFVIADDTEFTSAGSAAIAFDSNQFLVVFTRLTQTQQTDVFGTRVTRDGAVLAERLLYGGPGYQSDPSVDFDGTRFFVVWQDLRNDPMNGRDWDVYGTRVSAQGLPLDPNGRAISTSNRPEMVPSVAFDGTNHVVAWFHSRDTSTIGDGDIHGGRVTPAGALLDGPASSGSIPISVNDGVKNHPRVVPFTPGVLVVWEVPAYFEISGILGARLDREGRLLQTEASDTGLWISGMPGQELVSQFRYPAIAASPDRALATWVDLGGTNKSMGATLVRPW